MVTFISEKPHSEGDIMQAKPIQFEIGGNTFNMELLSYKDFCYFETAYRSLTIRTLFPEAENVEQNIANILKQEAEIDMLSRQFSPGLGLAWFTARYLKPAFPSQFEESFTKWVDNNPMFGLFKTFKNAFQYQSNIADWLLNHLLSTEAFELLHALAELQSTIKKKALEIIQGLRGSIKANQVQPLSVSARTAWASIQRKRLRKAAIS